jgi:DNA-binding beta-propeller fold protein YncE
MGSITDPTGEKSTSTGDGIAVYKFAHGQVTPERFIKIPPQRLAEGKEVAFALRKNPPGTALAYPAGFAVFKGPTGDRLVIANNLSDNVVLLDMASGKIEKSFDLSRSRYIPEAYPYTVITNKAGTKAWVSLWNTAAIAELDLERGKVSRWIDDFEKNADPTAPSSHPSVMLLNPNEETLFVALANADMAVGVDWKSGSAVQHYFTTAEGRGSVIKPSRSLQMADDSMRPVLRSTRLRYLKSTSPQSRLDMTSLAN